jgi:hypothetical protein
MRRWRGTRIRYQLSLRKSFRPLPGLATGCNSGSLGGETGLTGFRVGLATGVSFGIQRLQIGVKTC